MFHKHMGIILAISIFFLSLTNLTQAQTPSWTQLTATGSAPGGRYGQTAVYDTTNNIMIIYGGFNAGGYQDIWIFKHANGLGGTPSWTQLNPIADPLYGLPTGRFGHSAVYDSINNRMTIFGGTTEDGFLSDVWVLSNANGLDTTTSAWTQLFPIGSNSTIARYGHTAIYDTTHNIMTIFSGFSGLGLNDVWILNHANGLGGTPSWTQITTTGSAPQARVNHTAVYDNVNNRMIIFAGVNDFFFPFIYYNDTWVLSYANGLGGTPTWTQITTTGSIPATRYGHTAVYNTTNNLMTIFGGGNDASTFNDVWVISTANGLGGTSSWTQLSPTGSAPTTRHGHTAVYDSANNMMTIFAGEDNYSGGYLNDVWVLSNADFVPIELSEFKVMDAIKE